MRSFINVLKIDMPMTRESTLQDKQTLKTPKEDTVNFILAFASAYDIALSERVDNITKKFLN